MSSLTFNELLLILGLFLVIVIILLYFVYKSGYHKGYADGIKHLHKFK